MLLTAARRFAAVQPHITYASAASPIPRLRILTASTASSPSVVDLAVHLSAAGTRHTPAYAHGPVAAYLSRWLFKGVVGGRTALRLTRETELLGGRLSTHLGRDGLMLHASLLRDDIPYFIEALSDAIMRPRLMHYDAGDVANAVLTDAAAGRANPSAVLDDALHAAAFRRQGLGVALFPESVGGVGLADVQSFWQHAVDASTVRVVATGDIGSHDVVATMANQAFADLGSGSAKVDGAAEKFVGGEARVHAPGIVDTTAVAFDVSGEVPAAHVLRALLGGETRIRWGSPAEHTPFGAVVASNGATVSSRVTSYDGGSIAMMSVSTTATAHGSVIDAARDVVSAIKKIASGATQITDAEIARATKSAAVDLALDWDTRIGCIAGMVAHDLGGSERPVSGVDADLGLVRGVTSAEVVTLAKRMVASPVALAGVGEARHLPYLDELGL